MAGGMRAAVKWSAVQTVLRFVLGFASIKVTAVVIGPSGLALVAQLSNMVTLLKGVLASAITTSVVKETAREVAAGNAPPLDVWGTAARWLAGLTLVAGTLMVLASGYLSRWMFDRDDLTWVVPLMAIAVTSAALFDWVQSVLTGLKDYRLVAICQMVSAFVGAVIFIGLAYAFGLPGALAGTVLAMAASFGAVLWCTRIAGLRDVTQSLRRWQPALLRFMLGHYPMLLVHSAAVPLTALLVRSALIAELGVEQAGYWQAASRLTDMYTQVLLTALSMYVMPTLSGIGNSVKLRSAAYGIALKAAALTAAMAAGIYLNREWLVSIVFTKEFGPVRDLLGFMLLGDVCQIATWPLRAALVVQNRSVSYMAVAASAACCQIGLTHLLLPARGLIAAPMAYCATWLTVLGVLALIHRRTRAGASTE